MSVRKPSRFAFTIGLLVQVLRRSAVAQAFDPTQLLANEYGVQLVSSPADSASDGILAGENTSAQGSGCPIACATLRAVFPDHVSSINSTAYNEDQAGFWSNRQAEVEPRCFFEPDGAEQVAIAVLLSQVTQCPFAVKSGGHAPFPNASNIGGGLTILLERLNEVTLAKDGKTAAVGPGNKWNHVYAALENHNRTAVGGRISDVGVGGLTLGGGISFFSGLHGLACDNVFNYRVVTANGAIVNANKDQNSDLYWALRGGGNNFGLVTRFDLYVYPQGQMFGGGLMFTEAERPAVLDFLTQFSAEAPSDPKAALIVAMGVVEGNFFMSVNPEYADPITNPPIFEDLFKIPALSDTTGISWHSNITDEMATGTPPGLRQDYWNIAFRLDREFLDYAYQVYRDELESVDIEGYVNVLAFQQITINVLEHMKKNGGNALGLKPGDGPLIIMNLSAWWYDADDDEAAVASSRRTIERIAAEAKKRGLYIRYIYQNYASPEQDVFQGYGEENWKRLKAISREWDPRRVFQELQPGYHKLDR